MHAVVTPDKADKKKFASTIRPGNWVGTVHVRTATIRAVVEADSTHDNQFALRLSRLQVSVKIPNGGLHPSPPFGLDPGRGEI